MMMLSCTCRKNKRKAAAAVKIAAAVFFTLIGDIIQEKTF